MADDIMIALKPGADPSPLVDLAVEVADAGATLHLVSLVNVGTEEDEPDRLERTRAEVEELAGTLADQGYQTRVHVQINAISAGGAIARLAEEAGVELLVIGLVKRSRVGKVLMGSDAQATLLNAPCPVLCQRLD